MVAFQPVKTLVKPRYHIATPFLFVRCHIRKSFRLYATSKHHTEYC